MNTLAESVPGTALVVGCGDIGLRVARRLHALGCEVTGIVSRTESLARLAGAPVQARALDLDQAPPSARLPAAAWTFWFAPPPGEGTRDPRLRRWLPQLLATRLIYISTSGVYGDCQGRWIDEDEPLQPRSERGRRRLDAENALRADHPDCVILRVPGIYGPGRLPEARLRAGLPVLRPEESPYTNRIHAEDLAEAALHAAVHGRPGRAYHVADGHPGTMADYFCQVARRLGLPEPRQVSREEAQRVFTPAMWSFMEESKRLKTDRLRAELHFTPRYPSLVEGLAAC
jgi:nucleoside-diphosphate-sugar epimerase